MFARCMTMTSTITYRHSSSAGDQPGFSSRYSHGNAAAAEIGLPPSEILFVDDSQKNVDGALAAGWQAVLYTQGTDLGACIKPYL